MYSRTVSRPQPGKKILCIIFYFALFTRAVKLLPTLIWLCACMFNLNSSSNSLSCCPVHAHSSRQAYDSHGTLSGVEPKGSVLSWRQAPLQTRSDVQPEASHADPCPVVYHNHAVGTSIKMGCASVVSTHLSSCNAPGSPNISHRYFRVSASQKLSMPLSGTAGTCVASYRNTSVRTAVFTLFS